MNISELGQIVARHEGAAVVTVNGEGVHLRSASGGRLSLAWPLLEEQSAALIAQKISWWANSSSASQGK